MWYKGLKVFAMQEGLLVGEVKNDSDRFSSYFNYIDTDVDNVIFDNESEAQEYFRKRINRTDTGTMGHPRCLGSSLDMCSYDWRNKMYSKPINKLKGDDNDIVDTWDFAAQAKNTGSGDIIWDINDPKRVFPKKLPLNTIVQFRDVRGFYGVSKDNKNIVPRHSLSVVGYLSNGDPILYDMLLDRKVGSMSMSHLKDSDVTIMTSPSTWKYDYDSIKEIYSKSSDNGYSDFDIDIDSYVKKLKQIKDSDGKSLDISDRFAKDLKEFDKAILRNKKKILNDTNLSDKGFNELRKQAIALAVQESGTAGNFAKGADYLLGSSLGLTQIRNDNLDNIDKGQNTSTVQFRTWNGLNNSGSRPRPFNNRKTGADNNVNAVYTMLLLAENAKRGQHDFNKGIEAGKITSIEPGTNKYLKKGLLKASSMNIPDWIPGIGELDNISRSVKDAYSVENDTKGNNVNLTNSEILSYQWNNPTRLRTGDAQGAYTKEGKINNKYIQNIELYKFLIDNDILPEVSVNSTIEIEAMQFGKVIPTVMDNTNVSLSPPIDVGKDRGAYIYLPNGKKGMYDDEGNIIEQSEYYSKMMGIEKREKEKESSGNQQLTRLEDFATRLASRKTYSDKGYKAKDFIRLMDTISEVETGNKNIDQIEGGPAQGYFQVEPPTQETSYTRLNNILKEYPEMRGFDTIAKVDDFKSLDRDEQAILALSNLVKASVRKGKVLNPLDIKNTWLDDHWAGNDKDRQNRIDHFDAIVKNVGAMQQGDVLDGPENYTERLYSEYPAVKRFALKSNVLLHPDTNFTRDNTGVGSIEYFRPYNKDERNSVIYPNGYEYHNPNKKEGGSAVVYNPRDNDYRDVRGDYITHAMHQDEGYEALYNKFKDTYISSKYGQDLMRRWDNEISQRENDGKEQYYRNEVDGVIRNLMFEGTPEDFETHRYWPDARKEYLSDDDINNAYTDIIDYLEKEDPSEYENDSLKILDPDRFNELYKLNKDFFKK